MPSRRLVLAALLNACRPAQSQVQLSARPQNRGGSGMPSGVVPLGLRRERDSLVYTPAQAADPAPLMVYLHGATGDAQQGIRRLRDLADEFGFLVLSPASREGTWDAIRSGYGDDVRLIDEALAKVFAARRIDAARIAVSGFSDGASVALGLGISNGDLFRAVVAFSPGFIPDGARRNGSPRIFISHGTRDEILPIEDTSRRLVPQLRKQGYEVNFREFDGPHRVVPEIAHEAMKWWLGTTPG